MKYEAVAVDLRQIADEIFEKGMMGLPFITLPYPIFLTQKDIAFIGNHILRRRIDKETNERN